MWFFGLIVVLLIGAVAVVASGRWGAMSTAYDDRPDMTVPARQALTSTDIESARFAVGLRGYRMDEVDTLLERVAKEVAERDRRIADLERAVAPIVDSPEGHGFTSRPYGSPEFDDTGTQQPILVGGDFPPPDTTTEADPAESDTSSDQPGAADAAGAASDESATGSANAGTPEDGPAGTARAGTSDGGATGADGAEAEVAGTTDAADAEPETRAGQAAADEYERLQAEARAVLEAQSQPVTPRRTPAPQEPHEEPHEESQQDAATQQPQEEEQPPQDAYHQAAPNTSQPATPLTPAQQYDRLKLSQPAPQAEQPNGQEGEGAYQRPS